MIHCYLIDFIYCVKLRHWKLDWLKYHKCHKKYNWRRNPLYRINDFLLFNKPFLKPSITWTNAYYPNKQMKTTWSFTLIVSFSNISIRFTNVVFSRRIKILKVLTIKYEFQIKVIDTLLEIKLQNLVLIDVGKLFCSILKLICLDS